MASGEHDEARLLAPLFSLLLMFILLIVFSLGDGVGTPLSFFASICPDGDRCLPPVCCQLLYKGVAPKMGSVAVASRKVIDEEVLGIKDNAEHYDGSGLIICLPSSARGRQKSDEKREERTTTRRFDHGVRFIIVLFHRCLHGLEQRRAWP